MKSIALLVAAVAAVPVSSLSQDLKGLELNQLHTNCVAEIEGGRYTALRQIRVTDFKVLAWYRSRNENSWYVDNALCWAKITTHGGVRWVLVHMARNPTYAAQENNRIWHSASMASPLFKNCWFLYFEKPPTNQDVYGKMSWFFDFPGYYYTHWIVYDSDVLDKNWVEAIGEKPERRFSNPQGGANGRQPIGSETNRAPPAAVPRRSP